MNQTITIKIPDIGDFKDIPVIEVLVKAGDTVTAEQSLITLETDKATMDVPAPAGGIGLYRHGMRIQVKGNYLDIIRVLRSMEGLPWKVFWGEVSVKTEKYPQSHATVVIYTLNQDRAGIGI